MDYETGKQFERVWACLKKKASCSSVQKPSLPLNSVQYNNNGVFYGDSGFTRDPITLNTIIESPLIAIGDPLGVGNNTGIVVNDTAMTVLLQADSQVYIAGSSNNVLFLADTINTIATVGDASNSNNGTKIIINDTTQLITITNVPIFANDAGATGGGLTSGQLYKTTTGGSTFLKIVP